MPQPIYVAESSDGLRSYFRAGGEAIRAKYKRRPAMHLIDYERKMEQVREALIQTAPQVMPAPIAA